MSGSLIDLLLSPKVAARLRVITTAEAMRSLALARQSAIWQEDHLVVVHTTIGTVTPSEMTEPENESPERLAAQR